MVTAGEIAAFLEEARAAWSIDEASLAARARLDPSAMPAVLRGEADLSDLAAVARALGGTLDDLLTRRRFWEAPAVAFKSAPSTFELPLVRAALLRISSVARDRAVLADLLALPELEAGGPTLAPVPVADGVTAQAEDLARRARQALANESEPIASVREAMRRLGVSTFLTDFATESVDGMMWRDESGRACAAANVRARGGKLTALRMTFAHDLCHAVFDGTRLRPFGLVEARSDRDALEQRADAFAAHFLAPRGAVLRFLHGRGLRARYEAVRTGRCEPTDEHLCHATLTLLEQGRILTDLMRGKEPRWPPFVSQKQRAAALRYPLRGPRSSGPARLAARWRA
jgi:hypothetical protein